MVWSGKWFSRALSSAQLFELTEDVERLDFLTCVPINSFTNCSRIFRFSRNIMSCKKHCWSNLNGILSHKLHLNTRKHHQQQCKLHNVINSSSIVTVYELLIEMSMGTTWMQTPFLAPHSERARQIKIKLLSFGGFQFHGARFLPAEAVKCVLWSEWKEDSLVRTQMNRFSCAYLGTNSDCRKCARCCRIWFGWVWRP